MKKRIEDLINKAVNDFHYLIEEYTYGNNVDEAFLVNEVEFLKFISNTCEEESYISSVIEYFLNNIVINRSNI